MASSIAIAERVDRVTRVKAATLVSIGRWFFGLALVGLGAEHFVFRQFVTGRAPAWPAGVPGELVWVYSTGLLVILAGLAVLTRREGRQAALGLSALVFGWAVVRHVPVVVADTVLGGSWTSAGKALVFFGGSLAIAATFPPLPTATKAVWWRVANTVDPFLRIARYCLGAFLILCSLQHFKFLAFVATLIPAWFPGNPILWSQFAGIALLLFGVGLLISRTAPLAALLAGLMIFSWFWIVHLPRVRTSVSDGIALFEALAFSGLAFVLAGALVQRNRREAGLPW